MKIAIASGKGGTGKTTVAVNLYYFLSKKLNDSVRLIDCDVEEPNDLLFFPGSVKTDTREIYNLVPEIDTEKCTFCRKCTDWCEFNAITLVKNLGFAEVSHDLCHSCGACSTACEFDAITEQPQSLGTISEYEVGVGTRVTEGRLRIGSSMQTALIKEVKKATDGNADVSIFDAPPGTSCPVVETVSDADYVILVTEPTPFGLYDLKLTVELIEELNIPFGVVVNKAGLGDRKVYDFLESRQIELIGNIPFSKEYASQYSKGELIRNIRDKQVAAYLPLVNKVLNKIQMQ